MVCDLLKNIFSSKPIPLISIELPGFEPKTARAQGKMDRKMELRDALKSKLDEKLVKSVRSCKSQKLSLDICFNLYDDGPTGSTKKDLDNLLKILLDVLPDYMDDEENSEGLGLLSDDSCIFHINCRKKIVTKKSERGIFLKIYKYDK